MIELIDGLPDSRRRVEALGEVGSADYEAIRRRQ